MEQDITALKKSFEEEYREFLAGDSGNREFRQGELFDKYRHLDISSNDMAKIIQAVDSETHDKISKLASYVRRINNCIKEFKIRSEESLEQENFNESVEAAVENSAADSDKNEVEIRLESLRDEINKHDQNIADNVIAIGEMLIQAKDCVKKIKNLKWQDWLSRNIKMPRSTASRYVKCTERFKNVAQAQHLDLSKLTVSKMFELLSVPKDKLEQFFTDAESQNITFQDMTKQELRDLIKGWKQNNIPQKPKEKFVVRFSIAEQDKLQVVEILKSIFETNHDLSGDTLDSIASAIKSIETKGADEIGDTESGVAEE